MKDMTQSIVIQVTSGDNFEDRAHTTATIKTLTTTATIQNIQGT